VTLRTLADGAASANAIRDGLDWLTKQVTNRDVGLVYLAGHGVLDERERFYFLAADSDTARLRATAVPREDIQDALNALAGAKFKLVVGYPGSREKIEQILGEKPRHWREWWAGERVTCYEAPPDWVPATLTTDQLREIDARTHVKNELIDEAVARVMAKIEARGWDGDTDVIFTTDHGEFQGDFGLLFKGPHHVESLMRLPLIWRPAPNAKVAPAALAAPVGQVDLAPTFCRIAGVDAGDWMEGASLPLSAAEAKGREAVFTEWDSEHDGVTISLRTLARDNWIVTAYGKSSIYDGTEGELYDLANDPLQWENLWDDPQRQTLKRDLIADLYDNLPAERETKLAVEAPV